MKRLKQIMAILYSILLAFAMAGCGWEEAPKFTNQTDVLHETTVLFVEGTTPTFTFPPFSFEPELPIPNTEFDYEIQYLPETINNPENLPVLKWVCLMNEERIWSEEAMQEVNELLADKGMPFRLQFVMLTTKQICFYSDWFSRSIAQEILADADLIYGYMNYTERQQYLMPITEYVLEKEFPSLKHAVAHELNWLTGKVNDDIYGIPTYPIQSGCHGWKIDIDFMTELGLTVDDFACDFFEMDEIFAKIYENNGNKPFLYVPNDGYITNNRSSIGLTSFLPSALSNAISYGYQHIGACFGIDFCSESPCVVNVLETDVVRNIQSAILRYKDAGYVTESTPNTSAYKLAKVFYEITNGDAVYTDLNGRICIPITPVIYDSNYSGQYVSGVSAVSQHKESAILLLDLIEEDEEFQEKLLFGREGRDYSLTERNYNIITQEDGSSYDMRFLSMFSYFSRITENENIWLYSDEDRSKLETYRDNLDSVVYRSYPIVFDYQGLEQELENIGEIIGEYFRFFTNNETYEFKMHDAHKEIPRMDEVTYNKMLQELKAAGSEKIIAELQRQLDAWLAENPDWQE